MLILLNIMVVFNGKNLLNVLMFFFIWVVSFCVGVKISVWILLLDIGCFFINFCKIGSLNFVVFFVFVCVVVNIFFFCNIFGIVFFWIGDGVLNFCFLIVFNKGLVSFNWVNDINKFLL